MCAIYRPGSPDTMVPASVWSDGWCVVQDDGSPFFLSYAGASERSAAVRAVEEFFQDLTENVGQLIYLRPDVPAGFMDREMRGGMQWTDELIHAVGTCQVMVALLSARYLQSEWCGKEWHAFSQRAVRRLPDRNAQARQGCIIPVMWAPLPAPLPPEISAELIFLPGRQPDPDVPDHYQENGIFGMMRVDRLRNSYQIVTWQLAKHIAHIYHSQRTDARKFEPDELHNIFREHGHE
jgi:TIR domain